MVSVLMLAILILYGFNRLLSIIIVIYINNITIVLMS